MYACFVFFAITKLINKCLYNSFHLSHHTWPSVICCRRSYRLEFAPGRAPRSRLYRKHFQTVAEDILFCAAL